MEHSKKEFTYWNGEPCQAQKCEVEVADALQFKNYWARPLIGQRIKAVEVSVPDPDMEPFYLDNEDGEGWIKVTEGKGMWTYPHKTIEIVEETVEYEKES
jgi:hypothetical protein